MVTLASGCAPASKLFCWSPSPVEFSLMSMETLLLSNTSKRALDIGVWPPRC